MPSAQVPLPAHPVPPHCEYFGSDPPAAEEAAAGENEVTVLVADAPEKLPGPATDVVSGPLSMYTPLK